MSVRIRIDNKSYGDHKVLAEITMEIADGETVALTGPSGVGKSTLLRILCGLDDRFEGVIEVPQRISVVFQEPTLLPWLDCIHNLTIVTGVSAEDAARAMADVGLAGKEALYPRQLSLGQQRRLSLARAFVSKPDLLVMDEPFASLDKQTAESMIELTKKLIEDKRVTTLFVTHSIDEALALSDRILRLEGSPARVVAEQA